MFNFFNVKNICHYPKIIFYNLIWTNVNGCIIRTRATQEKQSPGATDTGPSTWCLTEYNNITIISNFPHAS